MSVYVDLADHISLTYDLRLPPHNEERAFVKIFRKLLSEEEAEVLLALSISPKSAGELAVRTGMKEDVLAEILYVAARKGIIIEFYKDGNETYKLLPFMPGIFESLGKATQEPDIASFLNEYTEEISIYKEMNLDTVIHMNQRIEVLTESMTISELKSYLRQSDSYAVMDCICRSVQAANGNACGHSIKDMCIVTGEYVDYYIRIGNARRVSLDQVYEIIYKAEEEGLLHEVYPIEESHSYFICNCCTCGCMFLKLSDRIRRMIRYDSKVDIRKDQCILCGKCIESCPRQVFHWSQDGNRVEADEDRCDQCGLCRLMCPSHAITVT